MELKVENIPSGYKESDIIWSSDDASIATVKNGKVKGVAEGTTNVKRIYQNSYGITGIIGQT